METEILKRLYIIRHGETDPNRNKIIQGSGLDAPLNQKGRNQALDFYKAYNHIPFQKVYTSNLIRTWQSVEKFIQNGIPHSPLKELNEISWGVKDGTKIDQKEQKIYTHMINQWKSGSLDVCFEAGESPNQVAKRLNSAMKSILKEGNEDVILMCIHGRALRILLCILLEKSLSDMEDFLHSNLCLYILSWDGKNWKIELENDTSHILN
jgi:probable phosphoglycerate mutase